ncbi:MAG: relaxase/mobilization nuclease domain-containing protein [Spirosomaceae bacterium]|jgi:hypothetical protein|nr:relaxase/mobilization nuclease domain-containing protein [Spirosomataceae bacterium]
MLAKANQSGKGFSGKIDYLYDGKLEDRRAIEKGTKVISHSDNIRVPNGADDKLTRSLLKEDFIEQAKQHKDYGKDKNSAYVGEHILSFTADDRKKLDPEKLKAITDEYIKMAGIDKTQYLAVTHHDTENLHVHILFNRAMNDGTKYKAWKEQNKTLERGVALALEHGFKLVKNQKEVAQSKEVIQLRSEMQDVKDLRSSNELLGKARNLLHLEKMCEAKKIPFSKDELQKTVNFDGKTYQEADLKACFLLNRNENDTSAEKQPVGNKEKKDVALPKSHAIEDQKSEDLNLKKQVNAREDDFNKRLKPKKSQAGHKIKVSKIERTKEKELDRGI